MPAEGPTLPLTHYETKDLSKRGMGWKISREVIWSHTST